jgi:hypothetical protein
MNIYTIRATFGNATMLRAAIDHVNRKLNDSGDSDNYDNVRREYLALLEVFGRNAVYIDIQPIDVDLMEAE